MGHRIIIITFCLIIFACTPTQTPVPTSTPLLDLDIEMESAFMDARNSLGQFIERIQPPDPTRTFAAVKTRFSPPDGLPQEIWVDQVTYLDGSFRGNMGDDIPSLRLYLGDEIVVKAEDVLDWMIIEDGKLIGGYTIRLAYFRMSPEEKQDFLKSLDYSLDE
jgi:uncharacterized protein YegJ (DUF2314 family)